MPASQKQLYLETLRRSSSALAQQNLLEGEVEAKPKRGRKAVLEKKNDASANILMDLRKAALHPLLFRKVYDDEKIRAVARDCMLEPEFATSNFDLIVEDMEVGMPRSGSEGGLIAFSAGHDGCGALLLLSTLQGMQPAVPGDFIAHAHVLQSVKHHTISSKHFMDVAKVKALKKVLEDSDKEGKRILLFSQVCRAATVIPLT